MPNPLTDELSDEAKAELAAIFAEMRRRFAHPPVRVRTVRRGPIIRTGR
jgi:hypothetical protein